MRIDDITVRPVRFPLSRPYAIAGHAAVDAVDNRIVEITAGDLIGFGAASPAPEVTGETLEACDRALDEHALDWLIGRDPRTLPALCGELRRRLPHAPAACAAIDIALHDLFAKTIGLPLSDVLGRVHEALPTSITIGVLPLDATLAEADEHVARGFRALKIKIGDDLDADVERVTRLRERVGPDVAIRVDANQGYSADDTLAFCTRTAQLGVELIEQPMAATDVAGLRALPDAIRRRVAVDESLHDDRDALSLAAPSPACGIFNIKLMKCGGIAAAQRIAAIAEASGIELMWGCMDESVISIAAALHVAFSSPATRYLDLDGSFDLARDVATGGFTLENGRLATTREPGLGVERL